MALRSLLAETVTVVHRSFEGDVDEYGNPTSAVESRISYPGRLEQADSTEAVVDRDTVVSTWRLFLPPEAVVDSLDQVEVDTRTFEVVGEPNRHRTPRGPHHVEVKLRRIESGG